MIVRISVWMANTIKNVPVAYEVASNKVASTTGETESSPMKQVKARKRKRSPQQHKKLQIKLLRITGQEYIRSSGQPTELMADASDAD